MIPLAPGMNEKDAQSSGYMETISATPAPAAVAAHTADEVALQPGDEVGEYVIEAVLGEGGFGTVYKAVHPLIGKQAAIKVLKREFSSNSDIVSRFISEARAVNQIRHKHIIDVFSFGQLPDGRSYYVMSYLSGLPLDALLAQRGGRMTFAEAIPILRAVAAALDAAHATGIAHRDLKPENVFVADDDVKLLDFGIAKLMSGNAEHKTATGAPMGTPYFMSPEQTRGVEVDYRTDIYAFGIMCYQVLAGVLPFTGSSFMDICLKQVSEQAKPPSSVCAEFPAACDGAILAMLEKHPDDRPKSVSAGLEALEAAASGAGVVLPVNTSAGLGSSIGSAVGGQATPATSAVETAPTMMTPATVPGRVVAADTAADDAPASPAKGGNKAIIAIALVGAVAAAGVVFAVTRGGGDDDNEDDKAAAAAPAKPDRSEATATKPTPPPKPATAKATPPPKPAKVEITFTGSPEGAEIVDGDGAILGKIPTTLKLDPERAAMKLQVRKGGFTTETLTVTPDRAKTFELALKRAATAAKKPTKKRRRTKKKKKRAGKKKPGSDDIEEAF